VAVTVQGANEGDTATSIETLIEAAEQIETLVPESEGIKEVVADKGYHSNQELMGLEAVGVRSYISEPDRGRRNWKDHRRRARPSTGIVDGFAAREANGCCASAGNGWNDRLRISTKRAGCDASTSVVTRTSANACCCMPQR